MISFSVVLAQKIPLDMGEHLLVSAIRKCMCQNVCSITKLLPFLSPLTKILGGSCRNLEGSENLSISSRFLSQSPALRYGSACFECCLSVFTNVSRSYARPCIKVVEQTSALGVPMPRKVLA